MKPLDLLVMHAHDESSPRQEAARSWMSRTLSGSETVGPPAMTPSTTTRALSVEHGATVCSCDGDSSRFPGVRRPDLLRA